MTMWKPALNSDDTPISQRILGQMQQDIRSGRLAPGTQLPTQRELAIELGVALGTVTRAYNEAREQGWIEGTVGRGTFVARRVAGYVATSSDISPESAVDLSHNVFLPDTLDQSLRGALTNLGDPSRMADLVHRYHPANGVEWHRQVGAQWLSRPGWELDADQIVVTAGAQHAMLCALAALVPQGGTILCEQLTYPGLKNIAHLLHLNLHGIAMDQEGIIPEAFEEACVQTKARTLYTIPTFQNPTGVVMGLKRRQKIAEIALRHGVAVVEDDVYGYLSESALPPIATLMPSNGYFLTSLSKCLAPGMRTGYLACPKGQSSRFTQVVRATMVQAQPVLAEAVSRWIQDGTVTRMSASNRAELRNRYALSRPLLRTPEEGAEGSAGAAWVTLPECWNADRFVTAARAKGVLVTGASDFFVGDGPAPRAVRVALGSEPNRTRWTRALRVLADLMEHPPAPSVSVT